MKPIKQDLYINRGSTFSAIVRWEVPPFVYKAISTIDKTAPVRLHVVGHTLKSGWRVACVTCQGMEELNSVVVKGVPKTFNKCTVIDADTIDINAINASPFQDYTGGGYIQFYTPKDLTGAIGSLVVKDKKGGNVLATWTTAANQIVIDAVNRTITILLTNAVTLALAFSKGVYELSMTTPDTLVTPLYEGAITVSLD